jgi:hypothetical protein
MSVSTIEGYVENGQIHLPANVKLPDRAKVFIVIPDLEILRGPIRIVSPRLANPQQAADFRMEVEPEHTAQ